LTPLISTISAAAYEETLKRLREAGWRTEFFFCTTVLILTVLSQLWITVTSWGWEILPHPPHSPDLHCQTSVCFKDGKAPQTSAFPLQCRCSKWSQKMVMCPRTHFYHEGLNKLIYCYDKGVKGLGEYVEK
jgi:hypothetical protein